ncbi:MAG: selenite/tellurite reduction operon rhodanese-like protein ExtH [Candidatus Deferrimicrobiaceae bacterium]
MRQRTFKRSALIFVVLLGGALVPYLTLWGCGGGGFDAPTTTSAPALLSAQTLKTWVDQGKVNGEGYDRVVILDVTSPGEYDNTAKGHIPGAQLVNFSTELIQTRIEGVAPAFGMIIDGSRMDALIQKLGIDRNTTIVFTSSTSIMYATRAYFTFRYWGFPKKCLKVLDGANAAWNAAFAGTFTTDHPVVAPSAYSVRNLGALNAGLRASLGEMMTVAADTDPDTVIVDTRTGELAGSYAGTPKSTAGVFAPSSPADYAVFEGHMKGGRALGYTTLTAGGSFLPVDNLVTLFGAIGVDSTKTVYVYCRTGVIASVEFFVLDGILGWNTVLYDGSWSQWGAMGIVDKGGPLAASSPWRTDTSANSGLIVYNQDNGALVEKVVLDDLAVQMYTTVGDPSANQIEKEDAGYITGGGGTGGGGTTTGGGGGGGC